MKDFIIQLITLLVSPIILALLILMMVLGGIFIILVAIWAGFMGAWLDFKNWLGRIRK